MRPFLLLSIRAERQAADEEHAAFARFLEVPLERVVRVQLGLAPLGPVDLDAWDGVLLGGGSFTVSDPEHTKSDAQRQTEADLGPLLEEVVSGDVPFLGACYGVGTLGRHLGAVVDREHPEAVGPVSVTVTDEGAADPLLAGLPRDFAAYGGHKESLAAVPDGAVVLATSQACPVQAFRVGRNVYATQFHPELDLAGLHTRIDTYATFGYFDPADAARLHAAADAVEVRHPMRMLRAFAARYGTA